MRIEHLSSFIVKGTSSEALQKLLEMIPSNLKTERRTLQDILANVFDRLKAMSFREGLDALLERLNGIWFFHINSSLCCSPKVEVQRVESWTVSRQGIFVLLLLMTRPRNFSFRNCKAAFVQCSGAPSCIHQSEERVAEWRSLGQIMSCSNLRYETLLTDDKCSLSSRNA